MSYSMAVLDFVISTGRFIILLGILIFVHELGHFLAAKLCNVYVVRLSLGFGRRLIGFRKGETDYCLRAIPLGGYVKMVGQEDMPRTQEEAALIEPWLPDIPPKRRFDTQPTRNKLIISFAGPFMNLIFAFPVLWVVFMVGIHMPIFAQSTRIGAVLQGQYVAIVWNVGDIANAFMAIPNLFGLILLSALVARETRKAFLENNMGSIV